MLLLLFTVLFFRDTKRDQTPTKNADTHKAYDHSVFTWSLLHMLMQIFSHFPKTGNGKFKSQKNKVTSQITFEGFDK